MSKVNLESYYWETVNDVDFFTNGVTCTDINVRDTVSQLCFQHMVIDIDRDNKKVFPSIEEICISPEVVNICIPNRMFPNVKNVKSNSKVFKSGKYLVVKSTLRLLNAFGQSEDTPLDGSDFISINEYALDGCKSHKFVNLFSGGKFTTYENSFTGSGFMEQPFANGLKAFRTQYETTILDIDENADIVILPEGKIKFHQLKPAKCVKVSDAKSLYYAARLAPEKIILEPGSSTAEPFDNADDFVEKVIIEDEKINYDDALLYKLYSQDIEEIESHISRYKTVDGIVYSADMKTLILCPQGKTGEVIIPDGVVRIRKSAFSNSKIKKVIFPDTMQTIGDEAFYACEKLKEIDFGHGITRIGENGNQHMFSGCAFKKITFPPQIKEIGISAFSLCRELEEVIFNEGLEVIQKEAFQNCQNLLEINLPASIKKVGMDAFVCNARRDKIQDMNINMTTIPEGLALAIIRPGNIHRTRCINVHIDNQDGIFNFVLPCSISATASVYGAYSNIVNVFNQMAYRGHDKKLWNLKCLETAYLHASYPRYVYVVAYKTYRKTKNKYTKEFLADRQKYVAKAIALEMEEKDFIDFVKLDFINLKYDADIVKCLEKQNWNVALAYILEEGKNNNNDAFVI